MSESTLASALVAAQAEMPNVGKDSENPHFRSRFASLDHIIEVTRPPLNKNGLSIHQFPSYNELGAPTLVTRISHTSGEFIEYAGLLFLQGQDMQKYGAALTYARRYGWAAALGIATDDDDDGNTASVPAPEKAAPGVISEKQAKRLWAIAKEAAVPEDILRDIVKGIAGVDSSKDIPVGKYDEIVDAVQQQDVPF